MRTNMHLRQLSAPRQTLVRLFQSINYGQIEDLEVRSGEPAQPAWQHLCTVGLVFKLMHGLLKQLRAENVPAAFEFRLRDHLDLVAMGTVADLVPLTGENRILARHGLRILQETHRPGLRALMEVAGVKLGQEILPVDISYRMGPRINASGRLADAALSVELLVSADSRFCFETARQLDLFNRERQDIERQLSVHVLVQLSRDRG